MKKVFPAVLGTLLMATAVLMPELVDFHPELLRPYYGLMWWTGGLAILAREAIVHAVETAHRNDT